MLTTPKTLVFVILIEQFTKCYNDISVVNNRFSFVSKCISLLRYASQTMKEIVIELSVETINTKRSVNGKHKYVRLL